MTREYDTPEYKRARRDLLASNPDCHWCGGVATEADHLIEQDAGGDHTQMVPSCKSCNSRRGAQYVNRKTANRMQARRTAVTKNKTDFFREPVHFDFLRNHIPFRNKGQALNIRLIL